MIKLPSIGPLRPRAAYTPIHRSRRVIQAPLDTRTLTDYIEAEVSPRGMFTLWHNTRILDARVMDSIDTEVRSNYLSHCSSAG
jgi:hypothetical protein